MAAAARSSFHAGRINRVAAETKAIRKIEEAGWRTQPASGQSRFDKHAQSLEGFIPLRRNLVQETAGLFEALLLQLPDSLAPSAHTADEPGMLHYPQVLSNRLPGNSRPRCKMCD